MLTTKLNLTGTLFFCLNILCCLTARADGGVNINQTRVIFQASNNTQSVTVNNQGNQLYLLQAGVQLTPDDSSVAPFVVTPPLARLSPDSSNTLRILRQGDTSLPEDRESLFYLSLMAIPAQSGENPTSDQSQLSMGFRFLLKLFYRPQGLQPAPTQTYCQLQITQNGHRVRITNPGPYYLTFSRLTLGNQEINLNKQPSMLAPMSHQDYPIAQPISRAHWQLLTDYGAASEPCQQTVSATKEAL
ncbi:fimbrial biogenesis chaperone [Budvicia diplopodorum]|uniref:fimbrial biogenesis chaperone n=1 Tax=Budvicia diplopodorum TaxID=1119056 RepID=UPI00135908DC|nr:molecular chaperone [Budvicia diplopodorum]